MPDVPAEHPRHEDLVTRERIEAGVREGLVHLQGLHAEGRGSAFDYLLGERTLESADAAARAAASHLLLAERPVISVNGNVAVLVPDAVVDLAEAASADVEVNLFHRDEARLEAIADRLRDHGATEVKGLAGDARLPGLAHDRAVVDADGIAAADVVLVPLEDGDRAEALGELGKVHLVVDLNPLSRSAREATVPVVDNVVRALPNITRHARDLVNADRETLRDIVVSFDAEAALDDAERRIREGDLAGV